MAFSFNEITSSLPNFSASPCSIRAMTRVPTIAAKNDFSIITTLADRRQERFTKGNQKRNNDELLKMTICEADYLTGVEIQRGGVRKWLYNTHNRPGEELSVSFDDATQIVSQFNISLDFKGWRTVWVSYDEALTNGRADMTTMKIKAPSTLSTTHPLYFDLLRLDDNLPRQSRDKIVPTLDESMYDSNNFWQQIYHWSQICL